MIIWIVHLKRGLVFFIWVKLFSLEGCSMASVHMFFFFFDTLVLDVFFERDIWYFSEWPSIVGFIHVEAGEDTLSFWNTEGRP